MYSVDQRDEVVELRDVPQSSIGAPQPIVLTDEHSLLLAFYLEVHDPSWDGSFVRVVDPSTTEDPVAIVTFRPYAAMMFGPPNDEAFDGHPLAARGLKPYRPFEVKHSSWIRSLERMNAVHPMHRPEGFAALRHFIFAFHDSTFECVAGGYQVEQAVGPLHRVLDVMKESLRA